MLLNQAQPTTLIVVYKDEMLVNQLKKLVETNDDTEDETVGIRDGSIDIVAWNEKTWMAQKKAGNITSKVLFIGDVKGTEKLTPVIDVKHDKYGIKFGWAGKQAIIYADDSGLKKDYREYLKFLSELDKFPIPDSFKTVFDNEEDFLNQEGNAFNQLEETEKKNNAKRIITKKIEESKNIVAFMAQEIKEKKKLKKQQMFYGIIKFYFEGLDKFINS